MRTAPPEDSTLATPLRLRGKRALDSTSQRLARIVPDRRRFRRVPVTLFGRFMRENREEYPCQVTQMSAGGMAVLAPARCDEGERIVAYLDQVGRVEGIVARSVEGGFAAKILASAAKRERIVNLLTWLINQKSLGLSEERKHERVVPRISASKLILPNGDVHSCRVLDVSLSGASIACAVKPPIDTVVVLGRMRGRVVRHHDQGVAIKFVELQDPDSIARSFG
jgi:hypothetical protein